PFGKTWNSSPTTVAPPATAPARRISRSLGSSVRTAGERTQASRAWRRIESVGCFGRSSSSTELLRIEAPTMRQSYGRAGFELVGTVRRRLGRGQHSQSLVIPSFPVAWLYQPDWARVASASVRRQGARP